MPFRTHIQNDLLCKYERKLPKHSQFKDQYIFFQFIEKILKCTVDNFVSTNKFRNTVTKGDMRCPSEAMQSINAT